MTELKRLQIRGIRSFKANPDDPESQTIEFEGPMTLISGENGTGKTTIIESLKYATMGDISKEMISDPKIWEVKRTDASVSLSFNSVDGKEYTITRKGSLIDNKKRKSGNEFQAGECRVEVKTLDNQIKKIDISSSESKTQVPIFLGVSPSVLENVLFCHQQDSCWPVESSSKELKERFDQIFGAEKYDKATKALKEVLKNLKKKKIEYEKEAAVQEEKIKHLLRYEKDIDESRKKIQELSQNLQSLQSEFDDTESKVKEFEKIKKVLDKINEDINKREGECTSEKNALALIKNRILNLQPKDTYEEQLESKISEIRSNDESRELQERLLNETSENIEKQDELLGKLKKEIDKMSTSLKTCESQRKFHQSALKDFRNKYNDDNIDDVLNKFLEKKDEEEKLLSSCKNNYDQQIESMEDKINTAIEKNKNINCELSNFKSKLETYNNDLKELGTVDSSSLELIQKSINKLELEKETISNNISNVSTKLTEIDKKEEEIAKESTKYSGLKEQCEEQEKYRRELTNAESRIYQYTVDKEINLKKVSTQFADLGYNQELNENNILEIYEEAYEKLQNDITQKKTKQKESTIKYFESKSSLEQMENSLKQLNQQLSDAQAKVESVLSPDDGSFKQAYELTQQLLNEENDKLSRLSNSKDVYLNFKSESANLNEHNCHSCPLCKREFENEVDYQAFVQEQLEKFIESLPTQISKCKLSKKAFENRLDELENIREYADIIQKNAEQIQVFNNNIKQIKPRVDELESNKNQLDQEASNLESNLNKLLRVKLSIDLYLGDVKNLKAALTEKNEALSHINPELQSLDEVTKILNDIDNQQLSLFENKKSLFTEQNQLNQKLKNSIEKINNLQREKNDINEKLNKQSKLDKSIKDYQMSVDQKTEELKLSNSYLYDLRQQKHELQENHKTQLEILQTNADRAKEDYQNCSNLANQIRNAEKELNKIDSGDTATALNEKEKEFNKLENNIKENRSKVDNFKKKISEFISNNEKLKLERDDLLLHKEYYEKLEKIQGIQEEIKSLNSKKTSKLGSLSNVDYNDLMAKYLSINDKVASVKSSKSNEENHLAKLIEDIKEYASTRHSLSKSTISLKAVEMCISDVERYIKSLDETLLDYHARKMQEVNDTIQQLWEKTYYGTDIDSIYIKCEEGKTNNSAYDYRVVMRKDNAELDMSGRCSAGQKMLASIIIRLALAETFSVNCGVIALDEPTTNLDSQNMTNLANQLACLVESRQSSNGRPFQLIVITHNTEFARLLYQNGSFAHFYQITRASDGTHHYSQIKKRTDFGSY